MTPANERLGLTRAPLRRRDPFDLGLILDEESPFAQGIFEVFLGDPEHPAAATPGGLAERVVVENGINPLEVVELGQLLERADLLAVLGAVPIGGHDDADIRTALRLAQGADDAVGDIFFAQQDEAPGMASHELEKGCRAREDCERQAHFPDDITNRP